MTETSSDPLSTTAAPPYERVAAVQAELRAEAKRALAAANALGPLGKAAAYEDMKKLAATVAKQRKKLETTGASAALAAVDEIADWMRDRKESLRQQLGRDLQAACREAGLVLRVVSRETPVVLRIQPLEVTIDFDKARAELSFARSPLATCAADAKAIVAAVQKATAGLETAFDPAAFFARCRAAWDAARAATGADERVEIVDFLPYLAISSQKQKFKIEPIRENFVSYSRAQFAYDVLRMRRQLGMSHAGARMNLGVATGTSASQKARVIYMEDEDGVGEYKLTVFFSKAD